MILLKHLSLLQKIVAIPGLAIMSENISLEQNEFAATVSTAAFRSQIWAIQTKFVKIH